MVFFSQSFVTMAYFVMCNLSLAP